MDEEAEELDFSTPDKEEENSFAILNSSLPRGEQQHHLSTYASAKRSVGSSSSAKREKQHRTRWHFGIRSRSPPMEVMSAIYASLKALGMEWKEKTTELGGLCAAPPDAKIDMRAATAIYLVETRARVEDVVVRMNVQLYYVDGDNYLVDFLHKRTYLTSKEPGAGRFDRATSNEERAKNGCSDERNVITSPYVFMDVACRLILDLAGGGDEAR